MDDWHEDEQSDKKIIFNIISARPFQFSLRHPTCQMCFLEFVKKFAATTVSAGQWSGENNILYMWYSSPVTIVYQQKEKHEHDSVQIERKITKK